MASRCTYYLTKCGSKSLCDQSFGVQPVDIQTHRHTPHVRTDKKVKTEGPLNLSNDIFYFKTVIIIGGPKKTFSVYNGINEHV